MTRIDRYVTVKMFDHINVKGQHLFGIKQSNILFYSDEINPTTAYMEYCQNARYVIMDGVKITRGVKRLSNQSTENMLKWEHFYNIEGETHQFSCSSSDIHHAFIQWKLQKLFQSMFRLTQIHQQAPSQIDI